MHTQTNERDVAQAHTMAQQLADRGRTQDEVVALLRNQCFPDALARSAAAKAFGEAGPERRMPGSDRRRAARDRRSAIAS